MEDIAVAIGEPDADRVAILEDQRRLLAAEADRLAAMVRSLTRAINAEKAGETMNAEEMFEVFGDFDPSEHEAEAEAKWPEVFEQSRQRTAGYGKEQWQAAVAEGEAIAAKLGALLAAGTEPDSLETMDAAEEHRLSIDRWYYPCSSVQHVGLGEMYLADARFRKYWEDRGEGLATYVHDAIVANARRAAGPA
ncbi:MAG: MerR family transcriptional regulator [Acidimicrobiia bacterium]|nr:MerR family transcriptional regulator [Acidimicrobiia bacterium]